MSKGRLEAFSDGVLAIVLTITVLKLTPPEKLDAQALTALGPLVLAYVIGFTFVGLQWLNHHRLFDAVDTVTPKIIWKNLNWLFWMTLIPFTVEWTGLHPFESVPATIFCAILLISSASFHELQREIVREIGSDSPQAAAIRTDKHGLITIAVTAAGTLVALYYPAISYGIFILFALLRVIRDFTRRRR